MKTKTLAVLMTALSIGVSPVGIISASAQDAPILLAVPLIAILLAIAGILAVLVATGGRHNSAGRVRVPQAQQQEAGQ